MSMTTMNKEELSWKKLTETRFFRTFDDIEYCCFIDYFGQVIFKRPKTEVAKAAKSEKIHALQRELLLQAMENHIVLDNVVLVGWDIENISFRYISMYSCHITKCRFKQCVFIKCNMDQAVIRHSDFLFCSFIKSYIGDGSIFECDFANSSFRFDYLTGTMFRLCNMERTVLAMCECLNTVFEKCDLLFMDCKFISSCSMNIQECTNKIAVPSYIPPYGMFTGWKLLFKENGAACLIELRIPSNAKRFSAQIGMGRAEFAKVVRIVNMDTYKEEESIVNNANHTTVYRKGKIVKTDMWSAKPTRCLNGIHFFLDPEYTVYMKSPMHYRVWEQLKKMLNIE